ncbi:MAG: hypothetical protein L3J65_01785 [Robiginitomaculum sp.]|nr:hypothetical protein [Robiginitomaculum sp.]
MRYKQRLNAFKPTTIWEVGESGISWSDDKGNSGNIALSKIKSVRLRMEPSRAETRRVALHIYTPIDHTITNIDYRGPLNFREQSDAFRDFVLTFHRKFPANTQTTFHKGSTYGAYVGNLLITFFIFAFLFFIAPLLALTGIPSAGSILRILIILILIPVLLKMMIKNKPATYEPSNIPMGMLK